MINTYVIVCRATDG